MTSAIREVAVRPVTLRPATNPLAPEFYGLPEEDTQTFLTAMRNHLTALGVPEFRGQTKIDFDPYKHLVTSFEEIAEKLEELYSSESLQASLTAELYSTCQTVSEDAAIFIAKKARLFQRLYPHVSEQTQVISIAKLMQPEIRPHLQPWSRTIRELTQRARGLQEVLPPPAKTTPKKNTQSERKTHQHEQGTHF